MPSEPVQPEKKNASLPEIAQCLERVHTVGLLTHRRPDGDAIGSVIAVCDALRAMGKQVRIVNEDPVPDALKFLQGTDLFEVASQLPEPIPVDLIVVLDAAGADRVGDGAWAAFKNSGPVVNIDHHISNTFYGDFNYVDSGSPATGQIIHELITSAGWQLSEAARDALYAAISTDTGSFRYPSTGAETYRIAADLVDRGLDVGEVSRQLYECYPIRRLLILRDLLQGMVIRNEGRVVAVKLTREMSEAAGLQTGDTEGLIDVVRSVDTVLVAVFFEELEDGRIRISSRSKSPRIDVGEICAVFGGGGHKLAAGARMRGPIDEAAEKFLTEIANRLDGIN